MKSKQDQPTLEAVPDLTEKWTEPKESRKLALSTVCERVVEKFVSFQFHNKPAPESDQVYAYATQIISIGCFYLELSDAIREGDGERVITCWRYLLPAFRSSGRKNYSVEALNLLYQHDFLLTPRQSAELLWSRFINTTGLQGHNIPADLNRLCKSAIHGLGANKSDTSIGRVAKALGTLSPALSNFDNDNSVSDDGSIHKRPVREKDVDMIVKQLQKSKNLSVVPKRTHATFKNVRNIIHHGERSKLTDWIKEHL